jgi:hypothetical protein
VKLDSFSTRPETLTLKPNRAPRVRTALRALRIPATLLALAAVTPHAHVLEVTAADAAPMPAPKAATAPAPVMPAAAVSPEAPEVVEAVNASATRASNVTAVFADRAKGLSPEVLASALDAVSCARSRGVNGRDDLLTIIDYSLPSTKPRLWVLDLERGEVLFHELVAHGAGSGDNYATRFSNVNDSRQTSLGLFLTGGTYEGGNGYSLKLRGLDAGVNDRAEARHIVMHGAWYVSPEHARGHGRIGRSWGCPALSQDVAPTVIDLIKGGTFIYSYSASASTPNACGAAPGGTMTASTLAR